MPSGFPQSRRPRRSYDADSAKAIPDNKIHGANTGPTWGRQDPGGPHVGPMNYVIWVYCTQFTEHIVQFDFIIHLSTASQATPTPRSLFAW